MPHSSVEAGERPSRTPWSEGGAALWTGIWNHAKDTCLTSVSPRNHPVVWGTAIPQGDEPGAFNVHARKCEARNSSRHISSTHLPSAYNRVFGTSPVGRVVPRPSPEGSTRRVIMPRSRTTAVPPRADRSSPSLGSAPFWLTLTVESRERILGTLSRIVAQQLAVPPAIREATNERN